MSITTNKSFVDLYFRLMETDGLQRKGLEFLVEGYEQLPNPFNPEISDSDKYAILDKIHSDFWYFVKEIVVIPRIGGEAKFSINKTNLASLMCMCEGRNIFSSQPRQLYGTMTRVVFVLWKLLSSKDEVNVLSEKMDDSRFFIDKLKFVNELLPDYIQIEESEIKRRVIPRSAHGSCFFIEEFNGILIINDLEHITRLTKFFKKMKEQKKFEGSIQIIANSTVGRLDCNGRNIADMIINESEKWNDQHFRSKYLRDKINTTFVYVFYPYTELVDNPDEWFELQKTYLRHDPVALSREILLER